MCWCVIENQIYVGLCELLLLLGHVGAGTWTAPLNPLVFVIDMFYKNRSVNTHLKICIHFSNILP